MRRHLIALTTSAAVLLFADAARAADDYKIDSVHSSLVFRAKHMNVSNFYGRFNEVTGTISVDDADATKTALDVTVSVEKIDTANAQRDTHLKSPDFFNAKQFPTITFKSKSVKKDGEKLAVTGDLTLHGVTKSITVPITKTGSGSAFGKSIVGYETSFTIKRTDFGMKGMTEALSDEVQITVSFEAGK